MPEYLIRIQYSSLYLCGIGDCLTVNVTSDKTIGLRFKYDQIDDMLHIINEHTDYTFEKVKDD